MYPAFVVIQSMTPITMCHTRVCQFIDTTPGPELAGARIEWQRCWLYNKFLNWNVFDDFQEIEEKIERSEKSEHKRYWNENIFDIVL